MAVRFFGPINNHTGYGNAVKNFAKAFSLSEIKTKFIFGEKVNKDQDAFINSLNNYDGKCDIDFYLHGPPWSKHRSALYKIAYFYWEADRLPRIWIKGLSKIDELWVPCNLVKEACIRARFNGPIKVIPTPCEDWTTNDKVSIPSNFSKNYVVDDDIYKFYSVFQWHNRKGFRELLSAYYKSFNENDKVLLILKVNALGFAGQSLDKIKPEILEIKRKLNLSYYPPVYVSTELVDAGVIKALHNTGDCYVSSHHGEGWGMPIHDAMRLGKQIITTPFGGVTEYLNDESAHLIQYTLGPVSGMSWSPLYGQYQNWAYPSVTHLSRLFRDVYENHLRYNHKAELAQKIAKTMTISEVSKIIKKELAGGRV